MVILILIRQGYSRKFCFENCKTWIKIVSNRVKNRQLRFSKSTVYANKHATTATFALNRLKDESYEAPALQCKHNTAVQRKEAARPAAEELGLPKGEQFLHEERFYLAVALVIHRPHHASTAMLDHRAEAPFPRDQLRLSNCESVGQAPGSSLTEG